MNHNIYFPRFKMNFNINPIVFRFGNISVRWYGIFIAIGFILAITYIFKKAKILKINTEKLGDILLFSSVAGIVGARLYYIIFFPGDFYKNNFWQIFNLTGGGIAIYGAILFGGLTAILMAKIKKVPVLPLLDLLSLGILIGQIIGRWGNFTNQEAFGSATNLPWGMASANTGRVAVHPCFLYESLGCFIIFIILHFYSKKCPKQGNIFLLYIFLYGFLRAGVESLRTDSLMLYNFRVSQILAIFMIFSTEILFILNNFKRYKKN